ncbi:hypothetical protein MCOR25_004923 [Pyricularia grisea]|nr:hypothetical protein MCOR25_004923 [Pyricularia grisea]
MADKEECRSIGWELTTLQSEAIQGRVPEAQSTTDRTQLQHPDHYNPYKALIFPKLDIFQQNYQSPYVVTMKDNDTWHRYVRDLYNAIRNFTREDLGLEINLAPAVAASVHSQRVQVPEWENPIVDLLVDQMGEFLATTWMSKRYDMVRRSGDWEMLKMPVNEIIWQTYLGALGSSGTRTRNLRGIFVLAIENDEFNDIAQANYDIRSLGVQNKSFLASEPRDVDAFWQLLGTQVLAGFVRLLINHHNATGNRPIEKVTIRPSIAAHNCWHALITLGRRTSGNANGSQGK